VAVLRLLAFNAKAWLAEHFNAYLTDPNEVGDPVGHGPAAAFAGGFANRTCTVAAPDTAGRDTR
jgi:hypothetical protein